MMKKMKKTIAGLLALILAVSVIWYANPKQSAALTFVNNNETIVFQNLPELQRDGTGLGIYTHPEFVRRQPAQIDYEHFEFLKFYHDTDEDLSGIAFARMLNRNYMYFDYCEKLQEFYHQEYRNSSGDDTLEAFIKEGQRIDDNWVKENMESALQKFNKDYAKLIYIFKTYGFVYCDVALHDGAKEDYLVSETEQASMRDTGYVFYSYNLPLLEYAYDQTVAKGEALTDEKLAECSEALYPVWAARKKAEEESSKKAAEEQSRKQQQEWKNLADGQYQWAYDRAYNAVKKLYSKNALENIRKFGKAKSLSRVPFADEMYEDDKRELENQKQKYDLAVHAKDMKVSVSNGNIRVSWTQPNVYQSRAAGGLMQQFLEYDQWIINWDEHHELFLDDTTLKTIGKSLPRYKEYLKKNGKPAVKLTADNVMQMQDLRGFLYVPKITWKIRYSTDINFKKNVMTEQGTSYAAMTTTANPQFSITPKHMSAGKQYYVQIGLECDYRDVKSDDLWGIYPLYNYRYIRDVMSAKKQLDAGQTIISPYYGKSILNRNVFNENWKDQIQDIGQIDAEAQWFTKNGFGNASYSEVYSYWGDVISVRSNGKTVSVKKSDKKPSRPALKKVKKRSKKSLKKGLLLQIKKKKNAKVKGYEFRIYQKNRKKIIRRTMVTRSKKVTKKHRWKFKIKRLKKFDAKKKVVYVQVRSYIIGTLGAKRNKKVYSKWSSAKKITI